MIWPAIAFIAVAAWILWSLTRGAPYVPTRQKELAQLFDELKAPAGQKLLDLGSGDGAVLLAAAAHGLKATGFELNPVVWLLGRLRTRQIRGIEARYGDYLSKPWPDDIDLIYVFGVGGAMPRLAAEIPRRIKCEVTLISYAFRLPGQEADRQIGPFYLYRIKPADPT
jgi:SAM-dependent methyltransferase